MNSDEHNDLSTISMMELFRMEVENHCSILTDNLLLLENNPADQNALEALMRSAHSAKGAARIVELHAAVKFTHAMEDVFVACQKDEISLDRQHIDSLLAGVDMLRAISMTSDDEIDAWLAGHMAEIDSLVRTYQAMVDHNQPAAPLPEAPTPFDHEGPVVTNAEEDGQEEETEESNSDIHNLSMLDLFCMEAEKHCQVLTEQLLALEKDPTAPELLESLMRATHSIKGAARIVELDPAVRLAHAMEDVFVAGRKGMISLDKRNIDILLGAVDMLTSIATMPDEKTAEIPADCQEQINELVQTLVLLAQQQDTGEGQPKSPPTAAPKAPVITDREQAEPGLRTSGVISPQTAGKSDEKEAVRSIRISAENMSRLMGLAGEVLIESRWLPTFSAKMHRLKQQQDELLSLLNKVHEEMLNGRRGRTAHARLTELRKKIEVCRHITTDNIAIVESHARHSSEISYHLYHEAIASRMLPFSEGIKGFPRLVRDVSRELGKEVKFEIIGAETPVDRDILEKIEAPLNHLLRNAIDHGIETPEERSRAGKHREASIRLVARHRSGMLNIIISDDGRGVDLDKIRRTVVAKNLVSADIAADLTDSELIEFLFLPNFSTKKSVNKISGRGVGLDVVRSVIHEIRGVIYSTTKLHQGTSFELQMPLTLSVMRALIVEISHEPYAIPLVNIDHVIKVPKERIKEVQGRQYFTYNEKRIGLVYGQQVLQTAAVPVDPAEYNVVVYSDRMNQYGLTVDRFWGIRDLVVQALDPRLGKIKDISAASVLEDGTPVLIVDVEDMVRSMDLLISDNRLKRISSSSHKNDKKTFKRILVADDSITVREVERKMLSAKGYEVDVAVDGIDALNAVRTKSYNLLVTDIDMPRMNGIELINQIKKEPKLAELPIIIISYKDREEDHHQGLEAGADYYLTKGSFQDEALANAVQDLIGAPHATEVKRKDKDCE